MISCVFSPTFLVSIYPVFYSDSVFCRSAPLFPFFPFFTFPLSLRVRFFSLCLSPRSIRNLNLFLFFSSFLSSPPLLPSHQQCISFSLLSLLLLFLLQTFLRVLADADRTLFRVSSAKRKKNREKKKKGNSFTNGDRERGSIKDIAHTAPHET